MIVLTAYLTGSGGAPAVGDGALAYRNATASTGASAGPEDLANESYDRTGYHDNVTNPHRMTIPSGVSLVRVVGTIALTAGTLIGSIRKGGASFVGAPWRDIAGTAFAASLKTGPLAVSASQYFDLWKENAGSQTFRDAFNFLSVEALDPTLSYAFVNKTGTQSIPASTSTALTWDQDVVNVGGGWHSTVTNNTRLNVPVGVSRVRVTAASKCNSAVAGGMYLFLNKNGAQTAIGLPAQSYTGNAAKGLSIASAIMQVTPGTDYFEVMQNSAAVAVGGDHCWATIEDASSTVACLVTRQTSAFAIPATTWTPVQWNAETFKDVAGMHDNSTNPHALIVPAGYSQARVSFCLGSGSTEIGGQVLMNGAVAPGLPMDWNNGMASGNVNGMSAWVDINPAGGDYLEVQAFCNTASSIAVSAYHWACLEVR